MKKYLIVRFSSIGDIVLCSPVIRCLYRSGQAEIHFICKRAYASLVEENPYVHKVWTIESSINELIADLRVEGFDHIIDLHKNIRSTYLKLLLRRPSSSFPKLNIQKFLYIRFGWGALTDAHITDRYFKALEPLGIPNDRKGLDFFIAPAADSEAESCFPGYKKTNYTVWVLGATYATKRLPTSKILEVIPKIKGPIVLLGGKDVQSEGHTIVKVFPEKAINLCGQLSIQASASIVREARFVISPDTGLMHIAAALNKPLLSIWGNTIPGFGMSPLFSDPEVPNEIVEHPNLNCRPCSKLGYEHCPKGHFKCMLELSPDRISEKIRLIQAQSGASKP